MAESTGVDRRTVLKGALIGAAALGAGGWTLFYRQRNLYGVRQVRSLMQTSVSVHVLAGDTEAARKAIAKAFTRMAQTVGLLSRFDAKSPVYRLNQRGRIESPPAALTTVLGRALEYSRLTDGAFDPTVAPVLDYYLGLPRPIPAGEIDRRQVAVRERTVGYRNVSLAEQEVRLERPGMAVTLDGIAKGYVVDQGIAALREAGVEYALIDAGGEIRSIAGTDPARYWNVGIADPMRADRVAAVVRLRNAALSTSGNYEVFFTSDRRLFHIIDPHTGYSPDVYSSVTVMADETIDSDALSVAAFSMPIPHIKDLMARRGCQWLVFSWDGTRRWRSRDLPFVRGAAQVA